MSLIIFLDFSLNGLQALFCCRSAWRSCRWKWFSIFFTSSRTREFTASFTTECGNPDVLKSMSTSLNVDDEPTDCEYTTGLPVLSGFAYFSELAFLQSREKRVSIFWANNGSPRSIMIWIWVGWEPSACWATSPSACRATSEPNSFIQSCFKEILRRGSRWRMYFLVYDLSSFHPNNFRNTTSWECFSWKMIAFDRVW